MPTVRHRPIVLALGALALFARVAAAQTPAPPTRPTAQPVFGGAASVPGSQTTLDVMVDAVEAYDQNLNAEISGGTATAPSPYQASGFYSSISPSIRFGTGRRVRVNVNGASNGRYYPDLHTFLSTNYSVDGRIAADITSDTTLSFSQGVTFAPAYLYGLFANPAPNAASEALPGAADYRVDDQSSHAYATSAGMTHKFSPHAALAVTVNARRADFSAAPGGYLDQRGYDAGAVYTYSLDRHLTMRLGYTYRVTQLGADKPLENDIDVGVQYQRPLSRTRRTEFGFRVGPTFVSGLTIGDTRDSVTPRLTGDAFVNHQIGRTWSARAGYQRGLSYIPGLPPTYSDGATMQVGGFLNRRADLMMTAALTQGAMAAATTAKFSTYSADVRLRVALTRMLAVYGDGLFYDYSFDRAVPLPPGVSNQMTRTGVRVGLTLWLPVIEPREPRQPQQPRRDR